jgi:1,4-alpha-glucan branching enzyme
VQHLISKDGVWNALPSAFDPGYSDLACSVDYITSHDVADACRLMNLILGPMLRSAGLGDGSILNVSWAVDNVDGLSNPTLRSTVDEAYQRVFGAFAILMTSVGMPMFLAGEEFGDVHDMSYTDVNPKQQDPVQWGRAGFQANAALLANVGGLIGLRTSHPALQRNEVVFFYFHPQFDDNVAPRVFAYCRTNGQALGTPGQVAVIANMGPDVFPIYNVPAWPWAGAVLTEVGYPAAAPVWNAATGELSLSLNAFSARVFRT